jgi:hypothetical protein
LKRHGGEQHQRADKGGHGSQLVDVPCATGRGVGRRAECAAPRRAVVVGRVEKWERPRGGAAAGAARARGLGGRDSSIARLRSSRATNGTLRR